MKLLIGGSPCTHWSIAQTKNRETEASGRGMTNFEFYTKNAARLGELIEKAVDDALEAKGCSLDLKYPEKLSNADDTRMVTWASWLNEEM